MKSKKPPAGRLGARRKGALAPGRRGESAKSQLPATAEHENEPRRNPYVLAVMLVVAAGVFIWSYWPTLIAMIRTWHNEPDYSHGFFVVPLAFVFLWLRRDLLPQSSERVAFGGLILILLSLAFRYAGAFAYIDAIDGWSIPIWVFGVVWVFWGWRVAWWAAPSVAFLWFMIPLPWRFERGLSLPLQGIATKLSTWTLQFFGAPAIAAGNTILLGDQQLEVAQACSGLRIFVGIFALAVAYVICVRRPWWERAILLLSALPIALISNAMRIVVTGLLFERVSGEAAQKFSHDISGLVSIPFAALLFAAVLWYVDRLFREVELVDVGSVVRRGHVAPGQ